MIILIQSGSAILEKKVERQTYRHRDNLYFRGRKSGKTKFDLKLEIDLATGIIIWKRDLNRRYPT